jgi:hypothetical protein
MVVVEPALFDFVDELAPPNARVRRIGPAADCPYRTNLKSLAGGLGGHPTLPRDRFQCPGGDFFNVGKTIIADERFLPRRCIWAHPWSSGELVIEWATVPTGRRIVGHSGMYWMIEREEAGTPVDLEVLVNDVSIGVATHRDGDGWSRFSFDLSESAAPTSKVSFRVSSADYQHRHFCFQAEMK